MSTPTLNSSERRRELQQRYQRSNQLFERANKVIPTGAQTFSKSYLTYPQGISPLFLDHGKGSHVWDVDGNEYIDFVNGLLPIVLGYNDPDVDQAVQAQMAKGVSFTLSTELEVELTEKLVDLIPCGEMAKLGKNGTDSTSAAIRVARAATGRDKVAVCGYHGWNDWYIGSTARHKGVPKAVRDLTLTWKYNDIESLDALFSQNPGQIAAVIMEPMNVAYPNEGFLQQAADLTRKHGAIFIFDEIITGFRFDLKGAQNFFGVTPDLATFGKGMANGYPMAALIGRADLIRQLEEAFISGTFGGETLSIAASLATIQKLESERVPEKLAATGKSLVESTLANIENAGLSDLIEVAGHPSWTFLVFKDGHGVTQWELKTLYLQEIIARGILTHGTHNLSASHSQSDLEKLSQAQNEVFGIIKEAVGSGNIHNYLACPTLEPLFKVR